MCCWGYVRKKERRGETTSQWSKAEQVPLGVYAAAVCAYVTGRRLLALPSGELSPQVTERAGMVMVRPLRPRCARPPLPKGEARPSPSSLRSATSPKGRGKGRSHGTSEGAGDGGILRIWVSLFNTFRGTMAAWNIRKGVSLLCWIFLTYSGR